MTADKIIQRFNETYKILDFQKDLLKLINDRKIGTRRAMEMAESGKLKCTSDDVAATSAYRTRVIKRLSDEDLNICLSRYTQADLTRKMYLTEWAIRDHTLDAERFQEAKKQCQARIKAERQKAKELRAKELSKGQLELDLEDREEPEDILTLVHGQSQIIEKQAEIIQSLSKKIERLEGFMEKAVEELPELRP